MKTNMAPLALLMVALGCASAMPPVASGPIDWQAVGSESVPELLTLDADGGERRTKLWLAVVDGTGYVRTSDTRWFHNIERDPNVTLYIAGSARALKATSVSDPALIERIDAAFAAKYGFQNRMVAWFTSDAGRKFLSLDPR